MIQPSVVKPLGEIADSLTISPDLENSRKSVELLAATATYNTEYRAAKGVKFTQSARFEDNLTQKV
ncbi:MAG: hypothetical protein AB9869_00630 [Verrucomicrobiia bacterium]